MTDTDRSRHAYSQRWSFDEYCKAEFELCIRMAKAGDAWFDRQFNLRISTGDVVGLTPTETIKIADALDEREYGKFNR